MFFASRIPTFAITASLLVCAACSSETAPAEEPAAESPISEPASIGQGTDPGSAVAIASDTGCGKMDILFVVDNSASMSEEQDNLAKNFPGFMNIVQQYRTQAGEALDVHVGVVTSDTESSASGDSGSLRSTTACGAPTKFLALTDVDVASKFACLANVGTDGSSTETPLKAAELAFSASMRTGTNVGFRRDDAILAVVILTDEDDQSGKTIYSTNPVADYTKFFEGVAPGKWATHVIAGEKAGGCRSEGFGDAEEAVRLKEFVTSAGKNGSFSSICQGDLASGLKQAFSTFDYVCRTAKAPGIK